MAEIVYGDQAVSEPLQKLVELFQGPEYDGTFYIGYPILTNVEGTVRVDALYVAPNAGVVVFDVGHLSVQADDEAALADLQKAQDRYYAAIQSKLLETPELMVRRALVVPITTISISTNADVEVGGALLSTIENLGEVLPEDAELTETQFQILNSVIERTATIRPRKRRLNVTRQTSRGAIMRELERNIANLDAWQKRAAIEMPTGPQRIRGLAGSGKTIVLALKAAYLHSKEPTWRIALTFQTRSLYQQFRRLVRQFCFEFSKQDPDWDKLEILHAWGSPASRGVYSEIARTLGQPIADFSTAKAKYGVGGAFDGICSELLAAAKSVNNLSGIFDAILIDEAQDLPQTFFELVYLMTKPPKRIVYAYDELQNLSEFFMMPAEDLFGRKRNGHPNVQLRNEPGRPKRDIILPVCYRNTPWALSTAHGLGFGITREAGPIQMFDEPGLWREIGYEVVEGDLANGHEVALRRSQVATPAFFKGLIDPADAVIFHSFPDTNAEMDWLANAIRKNLEEDELEHDDILIVVPEALTIRSTAPKIMRSLRQHNIGAHLVGVTTSRDEVFTADSIAITSIYRAKGNEAPMVYVIGAEYCQGGFNLGRKRNILFTAITRSRAWARVSGVGESMDELTAEYDAIVNDNFDLRFRYPTEAQLKKMRTLHRDRSSDEISEIERDLDGLSRLLQRVESGQISIDALPLDAQNLVKRLGNENSRTTNPGRRPR
jgi:superfamily I DNA and RNA helicase